MEMEWIGEEEEVIVRWTRQGGQGREGGERQRQGRTKKSRKGEGRGKAQGRKGEMKEWQGRGKKSREKEEESKDEELAWEESEEGEKAEVK